MSLNSVAMIIAPNLFLVGTSAPVGNTGARRAPKRIRELLEVSTAAGISSVIRLIIYYQDLLWQVSLSSSLSVVDVFVLCSTSVLWPPCVIGGPLCFCPVVSFFFFFFFSSPNLSGRRLDVYHTLTHGVALVRI